MSKRRFLHICSALFIIQGHLHALELSEAVQTMLESHPDILQKRQELHISNSDLVAAKAGYYPTLDLKGSVGKQKVHSPFTNSQSNDLTASTYEAVLAQNLFSGFGTVSEVQKQTDTLKASSYSLVGQAQQLALELTTTYLNLLRTKELLLIEQENSQYHEKIYNLIRLKAQSGQLRVSDYDEALSRLTLSYANIMTQENILNDASGQFQSLYGKYESVDAFIKPSPNFADNLSLNDSISHALMNHPSIRMLDYEIKASKAAGSSAYSNHYPRVNLELSARNTENSGGVPGSNDSRSAMINLSYNLYNGGADEAKVHRSLAQTQGKIESLQKIRRDLIQKNNSAYSLYQNTKHQENLLLLYIQSSAKKSSAYHDEFELGRRSLIEMLDAQDDAVNAKRRFIQNNYDMLLSFYRLLEARGELLHYFSVSLPEQIEPLDLNPILPSNLNDLVLETRFNKSSFIHPEPLVLSNLPISTPQPIPPVSPTKKESSTHQSTTLQQRLKELGIPSIGRDSKPPVKSQEQR